MRGQTETALLERIAQLECKLAAWEPVIRLFVGLTVRRLTCGGIGAIDIPVDEWETLEAALNAIPSELLPGGE